MQEDGNRLKWPIIGSLSVAILPPVLIAATGFDPVDLIVLTASLFLFWALTRSTKTEMGLRWGASRYYWVAAACPVVIMGILAAVAVIAGKAILSGVFTAETAGKFGQVLVGTLIAVLITEEGFFRGWLWGSLERSGMTAKGTIIWTSVVFMLWHVPTATMEADFKLPLAIVPIYLANVIVIGMIWGIMRAASGSVLVTAVSHAVWNACAYVFFGYSAKTGVLEISSYNVLGPERGILGLLLNIVAVILLWRWWRKTRETGLAEPTDR